MRRLLLLVFTASAMAACGSENQGPVAGEDLAHMEADQIATGIEHYITRDGLRQALLRADTGYFYEDSAQVHLAVVHLTLFQSGGEESANLTAETGELNQRTEAAVARRNVVLITVDGRRIETEELHYDPRQRRIWSDSATVLIEEGSRLQGTSFNANLDAQGQLRDLVLHQPRGRAQNVEIDF